MPRKPASKKYTGILAKPRKPWGPLSLLGTAEEIERRQKIDAEELLKRLGLMFDHYGIARTSPDAMTRLLYSLLLAHVPGFRVANGPGAHEFWTVHRKVDLVFDVQRIMNTGKLASTAFEKPELLKRYRAKTAKSLRRRYEEARRDPIITAFEAIARASEGRLSFGDIADIHHETKADEVREK